MTWGDAWDEEGGTASSSPSMVTAQTPRVPSSFWNFPSEAVRTFLLAPLWGLSPLDKRPKPLRGPLQRAASPSRDSYQVEPGHGAREPAPKHHGRLHGFCDKGHVFHSVRETEGSMGDGVA